MGTHVTRLELFSSWCKARLKLLVEFLLGPHIQLIVTVIRDGVALVVVLAIVRATTALMELVLGHDKEHHLVEWVHEVMAVAGLVALAARSLRELYFYAKGEN